LAHNEALAPAAAMRVANVAAMELIALAFRVREALAFAPAL
jgi:hypothetical protein